MTIEREVSNRERKGGGGSEGIRLRDKAAGAGCQAGIRAYCALVPAEASSLLLLSLLCISQREVPPYSYFYSGKLDFYDRGLLLYL